jgi:plastocyanin
VHPRTGLLFTSLASATPIEDSAATTPMATAGAASTVTITGSVEGNKVKLSTRTIEVDAGETVVVELADTATHHLYAVTVDADGSNPVPWVRDPTAGTSEQQFSGVVGDIDSVVIAVAKGNAKSVTYGPVITVKPKG